MLCFAKDVVLDMTKLDESVKELRYDLRLSRFNQSLLLVVG